MSTRISNICSLKQMFECGKGSNHGRQGDEAPAGGARLHRGMHPRKGLWPHGPRSVPEPGPVLPLHGARAFEGARKQGPHQARPPQVALHCPHVPARRRHARIERRPTEFQQAGERAPRGQRGGRFAHSRGREHHRHHHAAHRHRGRRAVVSPVGAWRIHDRGRHQRRRLRGGEGAARRKQRRHRGGHHRRRGDGEALLQGGRPHSPAAENSSMDPIITRDCSIAGKVVAVFRRL